MDRALLRPYLRRGIADLQCRRRARSPFFWHHLARPGVRGLVVGVVHDDGLREPVSHGGSAAPALVAISDAGHRSHGHGGAGFCRWRFRLSGGGVRFPAPHRWLHVLPCRTTERIIRPRIRDAIGGSQCRYGGLFLRRGTTPRIRAAHPFRGEPRSAGDRLDRDVAACGRFLGHRRGALARAHGRVHPHRLRRSVRGDRHLSKRRHHRHSQYRGAHIRVHPGVRAVYQLLRRHPGRWPESAAIRPVGIAAPGDPDRYRRDGSRRVQAHQSQDLASPSRLRDPLADGYPGHRLPGPGRRGRVHEATPRGPAGRNAGDNRGGCRRRRPGHLADLVDQDGRGAPDLRCDRGDPRVRRRRAPRPDPRDRRHRAVS